MKKKALVKHGLIFHTMASLPKTFEMLKIIIKNSKSVHKTEIKEKHIMSTLRNKTIILITKEESTFKKESCHGQK